MLSLGSMVVCGGTNHPIISFAVLHQFPGLGDW